MTNTPMTKEETKMLGNVSTDELVDMGKTHPRSALTIAYSEGVIVGINKAKAQQDAVIEELKRQIAAKDSLIDSYREMEADCTKQAHTIAELVEALNNINDKVIALTLTESLSADVDRQVWAIAKTAKSAIAKVKGK